MLTSMILAWLAVIFTILSAILYVFKRIGNKRLRKVFSRIHITVGVLLIVTGILHGIIAGNISNVTLSDMMVAPLLFTWNWGTISMIAAILLAMSYVMRKTLKKRWMKLHRFLTIALIALVVLHVVDVGIQLFDRLVPVSHMEAISADTVLHVDEGTDMDDTALVEDINFLFSEATLVDGVYEGSATGYSGDIKVSVNVTSGQVSDIEILSETETPSYFARAESVVDTIIAQQSINVDAVSGATCSSAGIVNAVSSALSSAVGDGVMAVSEYTYSSSSSRHNRHGHI